jgi:MFS family permease
VHVERAQTRGVLRRAWRHREYRYLLASFALSWAGDWCYGVAIFVWVAERTDASGAWLAATAFLRMLPYVVFAPIGGVLADRVDRRRMLVLLDVASAAAMVVLAAIARADAATLAGVGVATVVSVCSALYRPSIVASTPHVVGEDDLAAANAIEAIVNQVAIFVGPAIAAVIIAVGSTEAAFAFNGLTFAVSALLVAQVRSANGPVARHPEAASPDDGRGDAEPAGEGPSFWAQFVDGARTMRATPGMTAFTVLSSTALLVFGAEVVLHPLVAFERFDNPEAVGVLGAAIGIGGLAFAPFVGRIASRPRLTGAYVLANVVTGAPMALLVLAHTTAVGAAIVLVEGVGYVSYEVINITLLQRSVARDALGRICGMQDSLQAAAQLAGSLLAPLLASLAGLPVALVVFGGGLVVVALCCAPAMRPLDDRSAKSAAALQPRVAVLSRLALFDGAPQAALELVAGDLREETVVAGTVVVCEGDEPDDLFVVRRGAYDVMSTTAASGEPVVLAQLGPDDWFGEIGLVEGRPRNATVVATSDGELWRIPGASFLDALTLAPAMPGVLARSISARLADRERQLRARSRD